VKEISITTRRGKKKDIDEREGVQKRKFCLWTIQRAEENVTAKENKLSILKGTSAKAEDRQRSGSA